MKLSTQNSNERVVCVTSSISVNFCAEMLSKRKESCSGHFRRSIKRRMEKATRDDENYAHSAVWEFNGDGKVPTRHQEELQFENVKLAVRSYK